MSDLLCERCEKPALVIYERAPLCGPCAVEALDEDHHYLVVQVDDREPDTSNETPAETSTPA
jgi:hypothetical protein